MSVPSAFGFNDNNDNNDLSIKLVIYDFDQTISTQHLYYKLDGGQEDALSKLDDATLLSVFGGNQRKERVITHFDRISSKAEIAIISFGWVGVIYNALKRIGLGKYFDNKIIIGKDSDELKNANGSKAKCISAMKKERGLKSKQIIFVDDDRQNTLKARGYCQTVLIEPRTGMNNDHMKEIEEKVGVFPKPSPIVMELTSPKTVKSQTTKHYPSQISPDNTKNNLNKYKVDVPDWFDKLHKAQSNGTPVIQIGTGGDQTPISDDDEPFILNVPTLNDKINGNDNAKNIGFKISLNTDPDDQTPVSDDNDDNDDDKILQNGFKVSLKDDDDDDDDDDNSDDNDNDKPCDDNI